MSKPSPFAPVIADRQISGLAEYRHRDMETGMKQVQTTFNPPVRKRR
jgi:hypothetical protein